MTDDRAPSDGDGERPTHRNTRGRNTADRNTTDRNTSRHSGPAGATPPTWRTTQPIDVGIRPGRRWSVWRAAKWLSALILFCCLALFGLVVVYRFMTPPLTATILGQRMSGQQITQTWMPIERISPNLLLAVVTSEDSGFCRHRGIDWRELAEVVESARDGTAARGGSTIPMQTVKNLFLWSSKSYLRKALEIPITLAADPIWGKRRTLEIYLNIAEWGPGVFGAEAAAQYHFKKSAARLSETEAALLAAALPSPIARDSGDPGAQQQRLAQRLVDRMRQAPATRLACLG
jgi:monofunctional glycosyltransferase